MISKHFTLEEFLPEDQHRKTVPLYIAKNIEVLVATLLEPVRTHFDAPVTIHCGWRPRDENSKVGGVASSDHLTGSAVDFHVAATVDGTWEENTIAAFDWLRENKAGEFGQLILEDHRLHLGKPGKLWVHVSLKSRKHFGTEGDPDRLLISYAPRQYTAWQEPYIG